ncbi:MAG: RNA-binding S4 domain-containing protein [Muribaculum sp.]|nr:RNA-binding S4 domain-containing protein [Muribaculum sp.]
MDTNEKKPRRPRIGENKGMLDGTAGDNQHFEKVEYTPGNYQDNQGGERDNTQQRPYQHRPYQNRQNGYNQGYNRQGGYNNRQGGYNQGYNNNRQGGYNNRQGGYNNYRPRPDYNAEHASPAAEGDNQQVQTNGEGYTPRQRQEGEYQPRQYNNYNQGRNYSNNRQGGYNNNRQGGYNNNRQGGYNNNRQGGYNNNNRQGGYNNRQNNNNRQNFGMPRQGKSFVPRPKRIEYEMPIPDPNEQIRLNKFMANAGICSRREADEFIQQGLVKVNGEVVTELGTKISHNDVVEYDEKVVTLESKCYILLNKPKDCVTTSDDPNGRTTVMDLVKGACNERIYPVGRLDRNTTGVLLLTNDGDLASKLTHPKYVKKKIYHVWTDKDIAEDDMQAIADGIELEDGPIHADAISYATETDRNQAGIEIHSGRNRIVRRIFESLGYHVTKLDRVYFAGLTKKNLPRGRWRYLTQEEVNFLKMGSFE